MKTKKLRKLKMEAKNEIQYGKLESGKLLSSQYSQASQYSQYSQKTK